VIALYNVVDDADDGAGVAGFLKANRAAPPATEYFCAREALDLECRHISAHVAVLLPPSV